MSSVQLEIISANSIEDMYTCPVCLNLPRGKIIQCFNKHILCVKCFVNILNTSRLQDRLSSCPICRIPIDRYSMKRNLKAEQLVATIPPRCQFCDNRIPKDSIKSHELNECPDRITVCENEALGCRWKGPARMRSGHEAECDTIGPIVKRLNELLNRLCRETARFLEIYDD